MRKNINQDRSIAQQVATAYAKYSLFWILAFLMACFSLYKTILIFSDVDANKVGPFELLLAYVIYLLPLIICLFAISYTGVTTMKFARQGVEEKAFDRHVGLCLLILVGTDFVMGFWSIYTTPFYI